MKLVEVDQIRLVQPGLTVLISSSYKGRDVLMAAAWVTPVSYIPPRVAVAISPERFTYSIVKGSGMFAVNVMDFKHVEAVYKAGTISGRDCDDKFGAVGLSKARGRVLPIAVVKEAVGVVECRVVNRVVTGDHELFIGHVVAAYVNRDDAYTTHWLVGKYMPVLYVSEGHFMAVDPSSLRKYEVG